MKKNKFLRVNLLACLTTAGIIAMIADAEAALRTREQARKLTGNLTVSSVEVLEQFGAGAEYPAANIQALKTEIEGCGITYSGTKCLDSKFENFGTAGVKDVDTADGSGFVFFSRFKMKGDARILLMAVIANKSDCKPLATDPAKCALDARRKPIPQGAFRTANIWAINAGREKPEVYVQDFLNCLKDDVACELRPLLSYDPIKTTAEENALGDLEGGKFGQNFRRFFHAAEVASAFTNKAQVERAVKALIARSEVITNSGNASYRTAFFNLVTTKFSKQDALIADVGLEVIKFTPAGSPEKIKAALLLGKKGQNAPEIMDTLAAVFSNTKAEASLRKDALTTFAKVATTPADKDKVVVLLGSTDNLLRSAAYFALPNMTLGEDSLPTLTKLLASPKVNVRGNAVTALSRLPGVKSLEKLVAMMRDKEVDVALMAANFAKENLSSSTVSLTEANFITLLENSTLAAQALTPELQQKLTEELIPLRKEVLQTAFTKISGKESTLLTLLKKTATTNQVPSVRAEAAEFIGMLSSPESTIVLINMIVDTDPKVVTSVMNALNQKLLSDEHVDLLYKLSFNKNVTVRRYSVSLLGKISSRRALQALLQKSSENIDAFSKFVRADVATLLGAIYMTEASERLIQLINDEAVEVREAAFNQLNKGDRLLTDTQVQVLLSYMASPNTDVAVKVVKLLAIIKSDLALSALLELAKPEISNDIQAAVATALTTVVTPEANAALIGLLLDEEVTVRDAANAALDVRVLTDEELTAVAAGFNAEDSAIRSIVITQLKRSDSLVALELLKARVGFEMDEAVRMALQVAIEEVSARLNLTEEI